MGNTTLEERNGAFAFEVCLFSQRNCAGVSKAVAKKIINDYANKSLICHGKIGNDRRSLSQNKSKNSSEKWCHRKCRNMNDLKITRQFKSTNRVSFATFECIAPGICFELTCL